MAVGSARTAICLLGLLALGHVAAASTQGADLQEGLSHCECAGRGARWERGSGKGGRGGREMAAPGAAAPRALALGANHPAPTTLPLPPMHTVLRDFISSLQQEMSVLKPTDKRKLLTWTPGSVRAWGGGRLRARGEQRGGTLGLPCPPTAHPTPCPPTHPPACAQGMESFQGFLSDMLGGSWKDFVPTNWTLPNFTWDSLGSFGARCCCCRCCCRGWSVRWDRAPPL